MNLFSAPSHVACGMTAVNGGTVLTVPAGRIWIGVVTLAVAAVVATAGGAVNANARLSVVGANASPPAGDYMRVDANAPASVLGAVGTAENAFGSTVMVIAAPPENPVTLQLNSTNAVSQSASANGLLLFHL